MRFKTKYRIIKLKEEVWAHQASLIPPHLIQVPVTSQKSFNLCFYEFSAGLWNSSDSLINIQTNW